MGQHYFVTGIGTGVGKTIASAVFVELLEADYWKPIQSGDLGDSDSEVIRRLTTGSVIHPERYRLRLAASPHQAAAAEDITIALSDFELPATQNNIVIEGAGGLFVPINDKEYIIDLVEKFSCPVVLVAKDYLGVINHSILSVKALQQRKIPIACFVFNGYFNAYSASAIAKVLSPSTRVVLLPEMPLISRKEIQQLSQALDKTINNEQSFSNQA